MTPQAVKGWRGLFVDGRTATGMVQIEKHRRARHV